MKEILSLLVHDDHYQEPVFRVYRDPTEAVTAAKQIYDDEVAYRDGKKLPVPDITHDDNLLTEEMLAAGWIYYGRYEDEHGDNVRVLAIEVL